MILTDNGSIVLTETAGMPAVIQTPFAKPLVIDRDEHSVTTSEPQAPLIIEYVTNPPVVIIPGEKTTVLESSSGPRGIQGLKGDLGPAVSDMDFIGESLRITFDDGHMKDVPLEGFIDGGNF